MGAPSAGGWFVYLLRFSDDSLDTGVTQDVGRRCRQHNEGTASRYTRSRRPVRLAYHEVQPDQGSALRREAAIKAMSHREKEAIIRRVSQKRWARSCWSGSCRCLVVVGPVAVCLQ